MSKIENTTCFDEHHKRKLTCQNKSCKYWLNCSETLNCTIIAANSREPKTLQEIGDLFGLTRMRICQIEKAALKKLKQLYGY